jgi:hypothetical protein
MARVAATLAALALVALLPVREVAGQPSAPGPEPPTTARVLANEAMERHRRGEWEAALELATRSLALEPDPAMALLRGQALEKLGRLVEAAEAYEVVRAPAAPADAANDAAAARSRLRTRIPRLEIVIAGRGATSQDLEVKLDGRPIPAALLDVARPVDPGTHVVEASAAGDVARAEVRLAEGASGRVELRLGPVASPPPLRAEHSSAADRPSDAAEGRRRWGMLALGGGAALAAVGVGAGLVALDRKEALDSACDPLCPATSETDLDTFRATRAVSWTAFAVATVGIGAGIYLIATSSSASSARAALWLGTGRVGAIGRF